MDTGGISGDELMDGGMAAGYTINDELSHWGFKDTRNGFRR
jgi:hypothetical protein